MMDQDESPSHEVKKDPFEGCTEEEIKKGLKRILDQIWWGNTDEIERRDWLEQQIKECGEDGGGSPIEFFL